MDLQSEVKDVVIIGAGPTGLAAGYLLQQTPVNYLILEKSHRVANSWHQTWDDFSLAMPTAEIKMPGLDLSKYEADAHLSKSQIINELTNYAKHHELNIKFNRTVLQIQKDTDGLFAINTQQQNFRARHVIICIGPHPHPKFPENIDGLSKDKYIHSAKFENPNKHIECKNILVVGSGLSALSITEVFVHSKLNFKVEMACDSTMASIQKKNAHLSFTNANVTSVSKLLALGVKNLGRFLGKKGDELCFGLADPIPVANIDLIIFATGYQHDFSLVKGLLPNAGVIFPLHKNGKTEVENLYIAGIPSTPERRTRTITQGSEDAELICREIISKYEDTHSLKATN